MFLLAVQGSSAGPKASRRHLRFQRPGLLSPHMAFILGAAEERDGASSPKPSGAGAIKGLQLRRVDLLSQHAKSNAGPARDVMEVTGERSRNGRRIHDLHQEEGPRVFLSFFSLCALACVDQSE